MAVDRTKFCHASIEWGFGGAWMDHPQCFVASLRASDPSKVVRSLERGPRAAERESWQSLEVHLPEDPSICVDVTSHTAVPLDFADVWYYTQSMATLDGGWTSPYPVHSA